MCLKYIHTTPNKTCFYYKATPLSGLGSSIQECVINRDPLSYPNYLLDKAYAFFNEDKEYKDSAYQTLGIKCAFNDSGLKDVLKFTKLKKGHYLIQSALETFEYRYKNGIDDNTDHLLKSFEKNFFKHIGYTNFENNFYFKLFELKGCPDELYILYKESKDYAPICIDYKDYFFKFGSIAEFVYALQEYEEYIR